jgi:hypothetical protein
MYRSLAFCRSDLRDEVWRRLHTAATVWLSSVGAIRKPSLDVHARFRASINHRTPLFYRTHSIILKPLATYKLIHRKTRSRSGRAAVT